MSEPITLTERERAVFARISRNLYRAANELPPGDIEVHSAMFQVGMVLERMWREDAAKAESASPPRVPVSNVCRHDDGSDRAPLEPGQPTDYTTAREQDRTEGFRAGIEAAAKYHDDQAAEWSEHYTKNGNDPSAREYAKQHSADAAAIRALADKPAPDAARKGG